MAIVTGSGRGIGRSIAAGLAAAGAAVVVVARSQKQVAAVAAELRDAGGQALAVTADVTRTDDVARLVTTAETAFGPVTLLVNNAGVYGPYGTPWEADPDQWWQAVEINLKGPFLCARAVLPGMVARGSGRIVNVGSNVGTWPAPYSTAYACSKAALLRLTDSLAAATREFGVSVFAISPGLVKTDLAAVLWESMVSGEQRVDKRLSPDAWGTPERAAQLVVTLAAGEADALSGRFLHVGQDVAALVQQAAEIEAQDLHALRLRK